MGSYSRVVVSHVLNRVIDVCWCTQQERRVTRSKESEASMKRSPCGAPLLLLLLHLLGEGVAAGPEEVKKKPPPNIILMLADDLG